MSKEEKRVFNIAVDKIPEDKEHEYVEKVKEWIKAQPNIMPKDNDFKLPLEDITYYKGMNKEEMTQYLKTKYGLVFTDIYWEVTDDGEFMIMFDDLRGDLPEDIWDICYYKGFRLDYYDNEIEVVR
jgi:hypothetical protein